MWREAGMGSPVAGDGGAVPGARAAAAAAAAFLRWANLPRGSGCPWDKARWMSRRHASHALRRKRAADRFPRQVAQARETTALSS